MAKLLQLDRSYKDSLADETGGKSTFGIGASPYFEGFIMTAPLGSIAYHESVATGITLDN